MNGSSNITISARSKEDRLDGITENILLFFPLFYRNILRLAQERAKANPINMQMRMLFMLAHSGMMQPSEMGIRMGISKPNVTSLVDKLIEQGHVERRHDDKDRRVIHIAVTGRGRKFVAKRLQLVRNSIRRNLSGLDHDELDSLYLALDTFKRIISKMDQSG
ncbi:MAG: MarR family transcriptional regulator [Dehalococcoidia bacterium]|nr:MAG: MarR family transcriptional regulator [Dehalococcoidia bacterium]